MKCINYKDTYRKPTQEEIFKGGIKQGKIELLKEIQDEMEKIEELAADQEDRDYFQLSRIESFIETKKYEIENKNG